MFWSLHAPVAASGMCCEMGLASVGLRAPMAAVTAVTARQTASRDQQHGAGNLSRKGSLTGLAQMWNHCLIDHLHVSGVPGLSRAEERCPCSSRDSLPGG
jgi:hypothetical protein